MALLISASNHTIGCVTFENISIGTATSLAIFFRHHHARRLGISSPKMMDKRVTIITMMIVEVVPA